MTDASPTPHIVVKDGEAAIAFYEQAFGATCAVKHMAEEGKRVMFGHLSIGSGAIYLHDDFPEFGEQNARAPVRLDGTSCIIHLNVSDADAAWQRALEAGTQVVVPLENQFWGMRYGQLRDPFGHLWSIGAGEMRS